MIHTIVIYLCWGELPQVTLVENHRITVRHTIMGYMFQKKCNQGGVEDILFWKPPWNFSCFYFTPGSSRQNKAQPLDIPQNCVRSLGNSKTKNRKTTPGNSTLIFLGHPWKFLRYPWKFHILNPLWIFSGIAQQPTVLQYR